MKLCIIGAFGFDMLEQTTGGQPVKTRQLYYTLCDYYGKENVSYLETYGWKSAPYKMLKNVLKAAKHHDTLIMLPAHRGVQIFARLLVYCKRKYGIKIYYDVIGGWLPEKTENDKRLRKQLREFNGIWVETENMKKSLTEQGFTNVTTIPNFRSMKILSPEELTKHQGYPLKMCTFSRVMREKGIETVVDAVRYLNDGLGHTAIRLDIYGPVNPADAVWFEGLKSKLNDDIMYKGCVDPSMSSTVLRNYFCLLFPTHFFTEGIPGTIIDAYAAGVPVIASKWRSFHDVVDDGKTGFGYEFDDSNMLGEVLMRVINEPQLIENMKTACLKKARFFHSDYALQVLVENLK